MEDFTIIRKVTLAERWTVPTFHARLHPNQGVQAWLVDLRESRNEHGCDLIQVMEDILKIDADERRPAQIVSRKLRCLAMTSNYMNVSRPFSVWMHQIKNLDPIIENTQFTLWGEFMSTTSILSTEFLMKSGLDEDIFHRQFRNLGASLT